MNKCLRIVLTARFPQNFLETFVQKEAKKLGLEGTAQLFESNKNKLSIAICGTADALDDFMDVLHKGTRGFEILDIEIDPFLKDKDYRAVFRILE